MRRMQALSNRHPAPIYAGLAFAISWAACWRLADLLAIGRHMPVRSAPAVPDSGCRNRRTDSLPALATKQAGDGLRTPRERWDEAARQVEELCIVEGTPGS